MHTNKDQTSFCCVYHKLPPTKFQKASMKRYIYYRTVYLRYSWSVKVFLAKVLENVNALSSHFISEIHFPILCHSCISYRSQTFDWTDWFLYQLQEYRKYEKWLEHSLVNYKFILNIHGKIMVETFSQAFEFYTLTGIPWTGKRFLFDKWWVVPSLT